MNQSTTGYSAVSIINHWVTARWVVAMLRHIVGAVHYFWRGQQVTPAELDQSRS